jgi:tetratricopeptide (TPR) repeat protein
VRKTYLLLSGYEVSNNRNIYYYKRFTFLNPLIFQTRFLKFPFGLLFPLALAGIYLGRGAAGRWMPVYLFLASFGLSFVAFFVTARYRMPMVPFFIVLAVYAAARLAKAKGRELRTSLAILLGSLVLFNAGLFGSGRAGVLGPGRVEDQAQTRFSAAMGMYQQHRFSDALAEVHSALQYDSADNVLTLESAIYVDIGQFERARQAAEAAVRRAPDMPEPYGQLGNVYANAGQLDSARACFEKVCGLDPNSVSSWSNLGNVAMMQADLAAARAYFEKALALDPTFAVAIYNLGLLDWQEGNKELARSRWRKVLELDPSYTKARQALEHFH